MPISLQSPAHTGDLTALSAFKNTTPPSLDRHKSACPVPGVELLPACKASRETVSHVVKTRADRRAHSCLISAFSHRHSRRDVAAGLFSAGSNNSYRQNTWSTGGFMSNSMQFAGVSRVCVIFEEKFHITKIPVRHAGFP